MPVFLRSLLFNLFFFISTTCLTIPAWFATVRDPAGAMRWARIWARAQITAVRIICGVRFEVAGLEHLPPGPALIAARHESAFDILAWLVLVPDACFVVKQELTRVPLVGRVIRGAGMIVVDRAAGASAIRSLLREADRAKQQARHIVIFPEGTRVDPDEHPMPQPGVAAIAARTGLPVVPVTTDSGRRWGKQAFRKVPGTIHIGIQPPLLAPPARDALLSVLHRAFGGAAAAV